MGFIFIYAWLSLAQLAAASFAGDEARDIRLEDLYVSIAFQIFMAGIALMVVLPRRAPADWLGLRWTAGGWRMLIPLAPLSVLAMWMVFGGLQLAGYTRWLESLDIETMQDSVRLLRDQQDVLLLGVMAFAAIIVAPVCEEVVFRGYLYGVGKRFLGPVVAAAVTALIFSAAHASIVALLPLFLFGLLLTWLYERTGSLWAPIASHACFNAATVTIQLTLR
jgi:membrane protease YdiL (CAAX protease family)